MIYELRIEWIIEPSINRNIIDSESMAQPTDRIDRQISNLTDLDSQGLHQRLRECGPQTRLLVLEIDEHVATA